MWIVSFELIRRSGRYRKTTKKPPKSNLFKGVIFILPQRVNQFLPEGGNNACHRGSNARGFSINEESCRTEISFLTIQEHPDVDGRFAQLVKIVRSQIERDFQFCLHTINLLMQFFVPLWMLCVTGNTQNQPTFVSLKQSAKLNINILCSKI